MAVLHGIGLVYTVIALLLGLLPELALLAWNDRHPATLPSRPRLETRATIRPTRSVCECSRRVDKTAESIHNPRVNLLAALDAGTRAASDSWAPEGRGGRGGVADARMARGYGYVSCLCSL